MICIHTYTGFIILYVRTLRKCEAKISVPHHIVPHRVNREASSRRPKTLCRSVTTTVKEAQRRPRAYCRDPTIS